MTPEEILVECPELEYRTDAAGCKLFSFKNDNMGAEVLEEAAELWAQSRKEARELREENAKLVGVLDKRHLRTCAIFDRPYFSCDCGTNTLLEEHRSPQNA